ncbi:hypothetical protein [Phormidesmis priestleyi]
MKPQILKWFAISMTFLTLTSCTGENGIVPQTLCNTATAIATQTWEVTYYISKTSGGMNTQRTHSFQSNTLTNLNGTKPVNAASGPDDNGIWWPALPPRPTADEVDQHRETQERNDPPLLQRSVDYQLGCETGTLLTDALTYREVSRAVRLGQSVSVSYLGNRALKVEAKNP